MAANRTLDIQDVLARAQRWLAKFETTDGLPGSLVSALVTALTESSNTEATVQELTEQVEALTLTLRTLGPWRPLQVWEAHIAAMHAGVANPDCPFCEAMTAWWDVLKGNPPAAATRREEALREALRAAVQTIDYIGGGDYPHTCNPKTDGDKGNVETCGVCQATAAYLDFQSEHPEAFAALTSTPGPPAAPEPITLTPEEACTTLNALELYIDWARNAGDPGSDEDEADGMALRAKVDALVKTASPPSSRREGEAR